MFDQARGRNQMKLIADPVIRRGCDLWLERVIAFYGEDGGVDVEVIDDEVILNEQSVDYLYSEFTPTEIPYVPGSRVMLEQVVAENVRKDMSDRQKALSLMRRVRDNRDEGLASPGLFRGGSEEELLKRGALMCNEVARIYACLCQIAGMPARLHCSHISGHMMNEVCIEGKWGWVDSMKGIAPVDDDGAPASAWQLLQDPTLFERQPKEVWDDVRPPGVTFGSDERDTRNVNFHMLRNRYCYFHPREAMALGNYFVWEMHRYTFPWIIDPVDPDLLERSKRNAMLNRRELGWPDFYFNPLLVDQELSWQQTK